VTFYEFNQKFPTDEVAIDYFYQVRYDGKIVCPHCGSKVNLYRTSRKKVCICHNRENTFSPFSGTIFEKSSTDMRKWFYAIHLILNDKKGISGCQLQREIGVTYKTAWRMLRLIRSAMGNKNMRQTFDVFVEIDETYIGGKPRKINNQPLKRGRGTRKIPVFGVIERNSKQAFEQIYKKSLKEGLNTDSVKEELYTSYGRQIDNFDLGDENIKEIINLIGRNKNAMIVAVALSWLKDRIQ
jgi:transposase-like protein